MFPVFVNTARANLHYPLVKCTKFSEKVLAILIVNTQTNVTIPVKG